MSEHEVILASPPDREKLVAMVSIGSEQWAEINQGGTEFVVELYPRQDRQPWVFPLEGAIRALELARNRLAGTLP